MSERVEYTFEEIEDALREVMGTYDEVKGDDSFVLTAFVDQACLRCFRENRPSDRHVEVLRSASWDMSRKGRLLCEFPESLPFTR